MLRKSELKTRFAKLQIQVLAVKRTKPTIAIYQVAASSHQAPLPIHQMHTKLQRLQTKPIMFITLATAMQCIAAQRPATRPNCQFLKLQRLGTKPNQCL